MSSTKKSVRTLPSPVVGTSKPRLLDTLGPGLITGASDDDPSGIATYSQAGAQFGYTLSWTMLLTYPLMAAVQMISGRIGRTTGRGLAGNLRQHYPNWLLQTFVALLAAAKHKTDAVSRWAVALAERRGYWRAVVAIAAKNARMAWAMLRRGEAFALPA